ncbi:MAG: hypothetical protein ACFHVJ_20635 [Aestuariibacter sp.]
MAEENYFSALEFGAISAGTGGKKVWDFKTGQTAYDWFMCARYLNDLLGYQKMQEQLGAEHQDAVSSSVLATYHEFIHHQSDDLGLNFDKWLAVQCTECHEPRFYELGSTLMGCIEGMAVVNQWLQRLEETPLELESVIWIGVDNSSFMNMAAKQLHQQYQLQLFEDFKAQPLKTDVFFAKGVSLLYAIDSVADFRHILGSSRLSLFDYSFSKKDQFSTTIGTGKVVNYFTKEAFLKSLPDGHVCYFRSDKHKEEEETLFYELLIGEPELVERFIHRQQELVEKIRQNFCSQSNSYFLRADVKNIVWQPL